MSWENLEKNYERYIEDLIDPNLDKGNKKFLSMLRRVQKNSSGVGRLKVDGKLISNSND